MDTMLKFNGFKVGIPAEYVPSNNVEYALDAVEGMKRKAVNDMEIIKREIVNAVLFREYVGESELSALREKYCVAEYALCQLCAASGALSVFDLTSNSVVIEND